MKLHQPVKFVISDRVLELKRNYIYIPQGGCHGFLLLILLYFASLQVLNMKR